MVAQTWYRQALLSYKGLFLWLNWPGYISNIFVRPVLLIMMFSLTGRFARGEEAAAAYAIGMSAYGIANLLLGGIMQGFYYERAFATLSMLFASSGSRLQNYLCRGVFHWPNALLSLAISLLAVRFVLGIEFGEANWPAVSLAFVLITTSTTLFALALGNLCIAIRDWQAPYGVTQIAFLTLSGALIPRADLPPGLRELGGLLPVTHGLQAVRAALEGASLKGVSDDLFLEAVVGAGYAVAGYALFRASETYARQTGAYELA
jgi:ABC-2 type transport system permease protein